MLAELQTYYRQYGILAEGFHCPHFPDCSRSSLSSFTTAKETFVSSGYEAHTLPRILFLSLDSGSASHIPAEKTLASVRKQEEIECNVLALPRNKHWFRTHELAYTLLRNFSPSLALEDAKQYFAHANSAKCCQNNPQRAQANAVLFDNCRAFIPGEIAILAPDVLITQGAYARQAVEDAFPLINLSQTFPGWSALPEEIMALSIGGRPVIWIHTYHPRNPNSKQNRDNYPIYEKIVCEFITKRPLASKENQMAAQPAPKRSTTSQKIGTPGREEALAEGRYIYLDTPPDTPQRPDGGVLTQADCGGFEFMTMAQFCKIAEVRGLGGSRACNAFGGDRGNFGVVSERMTRAAWVGNKLRKYVLVNAVTDYFKEKHVIW